MKPGSIVVLEPGEELTKMSIKDACDALDQARERYKEAEKQESLAQSARINALNYLNEAQKAFDGCVEEIKKQSGVNGSNWHRAAHPVQQYEVSK